LLLRRLVRDARDVQGLSLPAQIPAPADEKTCMVSDQNCGLTMMAGGVQKVILEDLLLDPTLSKDILDWADKLGKALFPQDTEWQKELNARLCVVSDNTLSFLLETATEITARIRLKEQEKTVESGALWYEEALPAETVLASLVVAATVKSNPTEVFDTVMTLTAKTLQFGGNATVGRGLCKATLA